MYFGDHDRAKKGVKNLVGCESKPPPPGMATVALESELDIVYKYSNGEWALYYDGRQFGDPSIAVGDYLWHDGVYIEVKEGGEYE